MRPQAPCYNVSAGRRCLPEGLIVNMYVNISQAVGTIRYLRSRRGRVVSWRQELGARKFVLGLGRLKAR
jgi:hypothetical protein